MTEEQVEKKPSRVKRFFRWVFAIVRLLFIVLLALFLITCLYCQASPKVLALMAIILATLTIIPKKARKWIWLTFGIVVIALVVWVFLPEEDGDWRPYTFDEELAALEAKRAMPDEENAAIIYNKLLETYDSHNFEPNFIDHELFESVTNEPWPTKDHPELAQWLQDHKETITILMQACERERCYFPSKPDPIGRGKSTDWLSPMVDWAKLLIRAGNNNIGDGNIDEGLRKYISVLQIAKHLYQQPSISELLFAVPIEALGRRQIIRFAVDSDATKEHLSFLDNRLALIKHDWFSDWSRTLEYEKLLNKSLWAISYEVNSKGKIRFSHDPLALVRAEFQSFGRELPQRTYWHKKLAKARTILVWFYMPHSPQEAAKIIDASYEKYYAMAEPDYDWEKGLINTKLRPKFNYRYLTKMMAGMLEEAYHKIHDTYLRNIGQHKGSRLIIALRLYKNEHGRWPKSLEDVKPLAPAEIFVDPVNNDSFVYKLTEDGFTLYSKGKNNIDEKGDKDTEKPDGTETDDLLIWPPRSRKTKKESPAQPN